MVILYEIGKNGKAEQIIADTFTDEPSDMESFVIQNLTMLHEGLSLLSEQPIDSAASIRSDILALDDDGRLFIIELKKELADEHFLLQITKYYNNWKKKTESISKLYYKNKEKIGEKHYDSSLDPYVMVVAPEISDELVELTSHSKFTVKFIEIERFKANNKSYVIINHKEVSGRKSRETTDREDYDWKYYAKKWKATSNQIDILKKLHDDIIEFSKSQKWNIKPEYNKNYIAFKHGGLNIGDIRMYQDSIMVGTSKFNENEKPDDENEWEYYLPYRSHYSYFDPNETLDISKLKNYLKRSYSRT